MDLYSVSVESIPGNDILAHGPFRLVKYSQYLLREILPAHDALCYEQGLLMQACVRGDNEAVGKLRTQKGSIKAFYQQIWDTS